MSARIQIEFKPRLRAIAALNDQTGPVGRGTRGAADKTLKRFQQNVTSMGRVDTGQSRDDARVTFRGSNQHAVRYAVSPGSAWWIFQEFRRQTPGPAPALRNAIGQLRPEDFRDQGL